MSRTLSGMVSALSVTGALLAGSRFGPQDPRTAVWYARLRKPSFTPPGAAIGVAWTILGALQSYTGYRLMSAPHSKRQGFALGSWWLTTAGIVAYPWSFFGRRRLGSSTGVALAMLGSATATAVAAGEVDHRAARAAIPLVIWVGFAFLLSEEIYRRNKR